jgi:hypothetical protein
MAKGYIWCIVICDKGQLMGEETRRQRRSGEGREEPRAYPAMKGRYLYSLFPRASLLLTNNPSRASSPFVIRSPYIQSKFPALVRPDCELTTFKSSFYS